MSTWKTGAEELVVEDEGGALGGLDVDLAAEEARRGRQLGQGVELELADELVDAAEVDSAVVAGSEHAVGADGVEARRRDGRPALSPTSSQFREDVA